MSKHKISIKAAIAGHSIFIIVAANEKGMIDEEEEGQMEVSEEPKPYSGHNWNRIIAILFVIGIYLIIFLKILVLP